MIDWYSSERSSDEDGLSDDQSGDPVVDATGDTSWISSVLCCWKCS